jgi:hypothetical protein
MAKAPQVQQPTVAGLETRMKPTGLNHIFYFDLAGDGRFTEVAIVKMVKNHQGAVQSVFYINVGLLDNIDKGRLKSVVTNRHSDKYELWDMLAQATLSNGKNGLDYFHQLTKVVHGSGAVMTNLGGGLSNIRSESSTMVGAEFSDPTSAALETQAS